MVLLLHFLAGRKWRNAVLLLCSMLFYAFGESIYVSVVLFCIFSSWYCGRKIDKSSDQTERKQLLWLGIVLNLLPLLYFKYADFVVENVNQLLGFFGRESIESHSILLPIGISFFTFQALSYLIDVYRRDCVAQSSIFNLGLYISLFPQLIAGPIVRYKDINKQLHSRQVTLSDFAAGAERFIYGLGKKMLIANPLGEMADQIFAMPVSGLTMASAWLGVLCYSLQIYFDFSGYSSMAIGIGRMFGFRFLENFNYPYVSRSIREFWRRWHISLSNWFRDYVYIPLGGNRVSEIRVAMNLCLVFLLCGLWHGAAWNFIVWGLLHGLFLVLERGRFGRFLDSLPNAFRHVYVLFFVMLTWVFFRASDISHGTEYITKLFEISSALTLPPIVYIGLDSYFYTTLLAAIILSTPVYLWLTTRIGVGIEMSGQGPTNTRGSIRYLLVISVFLVSTFEIVIGSYNPFIYFRF